MGISPSGLHYVLLTDFLLLPVYVDSSTVKPKYCIFRRPPVGLRPLCASLLFLVALCFLLCLVARMRLLQQVVSGCFWIDVAFVVAEGVKLAFLRRNLEGVSRHTHRGEPGRAGIRWGEVSVIVPLCCRISVRRVLPLRRRCHFVGTGASFSVGWERGEL